MKRKMFKIDDNLNVELSKGLLNLKLNDISTAGIIPLEIAHVYNKNINRGYGYNFNMSTDITIKDNIITYPDGHEEKIKESIYYIKEGKRTYEKEDGNKLTREDLTEVSNGYKYLDYDAYIEFKTDEGYIVSQSTHEKFEERNEEYVAQELRCSELRQALEELKYNRAEMTKYLEIEGLEEYISHDSVGNALYNAKNDYYNFTNKEMVEHVYGLTSDDMKLESFPDNFNINNLVFENTNDTKQYLPMNPISRELFELNHIANYGAYNSLSGFDYFDSDQKKIHGLNDLYNYYLGEIECRIGACNQAIDEVSHNNLIKYYDKIIDEINYKISYYEKELNKQEEIFQEMQKTFPQKYLYKDESIVYGFNVFGQLAVIFDKYENQVLIKYNKNNNIDEIIEKNNTIRFTYKNSLLSSIKDDHLNEITYEYDTNGKLLTITKKGIKSQLSYSNGKLTGIVHNKKRYSIGYNENEMVSNITNLRTSNDSLSFSYEFIETDNVSSVKVISSKTNDEYIYLFNTKECYCEYQLRNNRMYNLITHENKDNKYELEVKANKDSNIIYSGINLSGNVNVWKLKRRDYVLICDITMESAAIINNQIQTSMYENIENDPNKSLFTIEVNLKYDYETITYKNSFESGVGRKQVIIPISLKENYLKEVVIPNEFVISSDIKRIESYKVNSVKLFESSYSYKEYDEHKNLIYVYNSEEKLPMLEGNDYAYISSDINYTYDDYNRLLKEEKTIHYKYLERKEDKSEVIEYFYNSLGRLASKEYKDIVTKYTYDEYGQVIKEEMYHFSNPVNKYCKEYVYNESGLLIKEIIDGNENNISYNKDSNLIEKDDNYIYGYDKYKNLIGITSSKNSKNYNLQEIKNGLIISKSSPTNKYNYTYDSMDRLIKVEGENVLIEYQYHDEEFKEIINCNSLKIINIKDKYDKLLSTEYLKDDIRIGFINYTYEDDLLLSVYEGTNDYENQTSYEYFDKKLKRLSKNDYQITYKNDYYDNIVEINYEFEDDLLSYEYEYEDELLKRISVLDFNNEIAYDDLKRIKKETLNNITKEYYYESTLGNVTNRIIGIKEAINNSVSYKKYKYDDLGNIIEINDGNKVSYVYDSLGQLIRENNKNLNKTVIYEYDNNGNRILEYKYDYTLDDNLENEEVKTYNYDKDKLIKCNDLEFIYDDLGNIISYNNNSLEYENNHLSRFNNVSFKYDLSGNRIKKIIGNKEHRYVLEDDKILKEIIRTYTDFNGQAYSKDEILYLYGNNGVIGFKYNDEEYHYNRNILGDITEIYKGNELVGKYEYDAWGKHSVVLDINGIASINPFRYRGYYYDEETELYWLLSRYYDPSIGRFISPDSVDYLDLESINGLNLYCYCGNNPIMYVDPSGHFAITSFLIGLGISALIGAVAGGVSYAASELVSYAFTGKFSWSWASFAGSILGGAIGGTLAAIPGVNTMVVAGVSGFASTAIGMGLENAWEGKYYTFGQIMFVSTINGLISSAAGGLFEAIPIKGLTSGRGSYSAITKQITTKFFNGTIKRITYNTFSKMLTYNMLGGMIGAGVSGVMDATGANDWMANWFHQRTGF